MDLENKLKQELITAIENSFGVSNRRLAMLIAEFTKGQKNLIKNKKTNDCYMILKTIPFENEDVFYSGDFMYLSEIKEKYGLDISLQKLGVMLSSMGVKKQEYRFKRNGEIVKMKSKVGFYLKSSTPFNESNRGDYNMLKNQYNG